MKDVYPNGHFDGSESKSSWECLDMRVIRVLTVSPNRHEDSGFPNYHEDVF